MEYFENLKHLENKRKNYNLNFKTPYLTLKRLERKLIKIQGQIVPDYIRRTAIARKKPSKPAQILIKQKKEILEGARILDFGCGKSIDAEYISKVSKCKLIEKYDPGFGYYAKEEWKEPFDVILCFYVLNVLPMNIRQLIASAVNDIVCKGGFIIIAVREDRSAIQKSWIPFDDGWWTAKNTFQTFFYLNDNDKKLFILFPHYEFNRLGRATWLLTKLF